MHALTLWFSAAWSSAWAPLAVDVIVKATVMLLLAVVAAALLHRSSAAVRHRVWCLTFAALLLLPALSAGLPEWRLEVLPTVVGTLRVPQLNALDASPAESGAADAQRLASADTRTTSRAALFADSPPFAAPGGPLAEREDYGGLRFANRPDAAIVDGPGPSSATSRGPLGLAALWLLGAMIAASPLAAGLLRNYLLRRRARPVAEAARTGLLDELRSRLSLRRRVALYETRAALMPMTWGMFAPVVLLPHAAREWTERLRRFVLLHELAHVKRCDVGFQMLARLACAFYWFHPLVWYALRRLRIERELACDDCVVQAGERPSDYAAELLQIARSFQPLRLAAAVPMAQTSNLEHRIRALFDRARSHLPVSARSARLLLLAATVTITAIAVIRLAPRQTAEADEQSTPETQSDVAQPPSALTAESAAEDIVMVSGKVLDPDGKPFVGAQIFAVRWYWQPHIPHPPLSEAKSGSGGRFTISFRKSQLDVDVGGRWEETAIVATADGFGTGWVTWRDIPSGKDAVLQLVHDVAVKGRVVDLEGRPIAGVAVKLGDIATAKNGNLDAYLAAIRRGEFPWNSFRELDDTLPQFDAWPSRIVTDADGQFRIDGIGRERRVHLSFQGPTIAYQKAIAVTRLSETLLMKISPGRDESETVYGAEFEIAAPPTRPIEGVVCDADTGQTLAGVSIESDMFAGSNLAEERHLRAVSDEVGHYRLIGMPKGEGNRLLAMPNDNQPYLMREIAVPDARGLEPVQVDIELRRGVWITGHVTDKASGKPVIARLHYLPFRSNRYAQNTPEFGSEFTADGFQRRYASRPDGSYRLVGLPGRAIVGAECAVDSYRCGVGADAIAGSDEAGHFDTYANPIQPGKRWPNAMKEIDPPPGTDSVVCDFQLDPGESLTVDVVDADGQPVRGCDFDGLRGGSWYESALDKSRVQVNNLGPDETRTLVVRHATRKLGKVFRVRLADVPSRSRSVTLEPSAKVIGRLFDRQGVAISGAEVTALTNPAEDFVKRLAPVTTDEEGRFEYNNIPTGCPYDLLVASARVGHAPIADDIALEPGETKDLGDVTVGGAVPTGDASEPAKPADESESSGAKGKNGSAAITLRGRVLDPAGKPLPGARVRVIHVDTESNTWVENGRLLAESKTKADGAFSIEVRAPAPAAIREHLVHSSTVVLADAPGKGFDWSEQDWSHQQPAGKALSLQLC